jgi:hypothetical protein
VHDIIEGASARKMEDPAVAAAEAATDAAGDPAPVQDEHADDAASVPQAQSWRDVLPIHPATEKVRPATDEEQGVLRGDLKQHGQPEPVVLVRIRQGCEQLLDGRTRLDLQEANGDQVIDADGHLTVPYRTVELPDDDAAASYVLSLNAHRRHLNQKERRELVAQLLRADPSRSDRQIASMVKASPTFVGKERAKREVTGDVSTADTRRDTKGRAQPAHHNAKAPARPDPVAAIKRMCGPLKITVETALAAKRDLEHQRRVFETAQQCLAEMQRARGLADRDDIGPTSSGETERLRADNDSLRDQLRQRDFKIIGLESEIEELRAPSSAAFKTL